MSDGRRIALSRPEWVEAQQIAWAVAPGGELWLANRAGYHFHQVTFAGDTIRTIKLGDPAQVPAGPVDEADYEPVISRLRVSAEGWLWVRRVIQTREEEADSAAWDLFDNCGRYRGAVSKSISPVVVHIGSGGNVYAVVSDAFDVDYLLRMRLESEDGSAVTAEACVY